MTHPPLSHGLWNFKHVYTAFYVTTQLHSPSKHITPTSSPCVQLSTTPHPGKVQLLSVISVPMQFTRLINIGPLPEPSFTRQTAPPGYPRLLKMETGKKKPCLKVDVPECMVTRECVLWWRHLGVSLVTTRCCERDMCAHQKSARVLTHN